LARAVLADPRILILDEATSSIDIRTEHRSQAALSRLLRKLATSVESGGRALPTTIGTGDVRTYLGRARFHSEVAERTDTPGIATGLAVTGTGGDVLFIEAASMPGEHGLTLTGQLGDVMKESAQIALSYVRSHAADLGIDVAAFKGQQFHVHVPAGAVPKDGPSAGVTMVTALASLLSGRPVREQVGMTGEVTLQGKVLPIGGVKQKLLAAHHPSGKYGCGGSRAGPVARGSGGRRAAPRGLSVWRRSLPWCGFLRCMP
jgi:ATP-dependent Lon protease